MEDEDQPILDYSRWWLTVDTFATNYVELPPAGEFYKQFKIANHCPFCDSQAAEVLSINYQAGVSDPEDLFGDDIALSVWGCPSCGWWFENFCRWDVEIIGWERFKRRIALLREFDIREENMPLITLQAELRRRPHLINNVHPKTLEILVADVLADFFKTEVTVVGRTNDGGIDLVYIDCDIPFAVQVKRRISNTASEGVSLVREFLGACVLKGVRGATIITTARAFTKGATRTAHEAVTKNLVDTFELIARDRFLDIFGQKRGIDLYPWSNVVRSWLDRWEKDKHRADVRFKQEFIK